ncbi:hypothetical protein TRAPUB_688 [Trametes pubescens]|uniref:AC transposase n=1 Tax=Trametes pubescens TaxID=154538 RepID=A0A1M2VLG5_TRAPU|nr:hypothetical protein TRAPUB_688 [Trametes pubescens]
MAAPQSAYNQYQAWYPLMPGHPHPGSQTGPPMRQAPQQELQIRPWVPPQEVTHSPINIEQASSTAQGSRKRKEPSQASDTIEAPSDDTLINTTPLRKATSVQDATDVYYFVRALQTDAVPTALPDEALERVLHDNPKSEWLGCKACKDFWKTWHNGSGVTSTVRRHLIKKHEKLYFTAIEVLGLKAHAPPPQSTFAETVKEPFSVHGFETKLVQWSVVDDQSLHVVDSKEFREMILFDAAHLQDEDIPHRSKLRMLIQVSYNAHRAEVRIEMQGALGRISFTADLWTDPILRAFMAVTAHYIVRIEGKHLTLKARLIAFKHIEGRHDGVSLAHAFFGVLEEEGVAPKIGSITMDSATSNDTKMDGLEALFTSRRIVFDHNGNCVRCFPHSVNRSVKAVLEAIKSNPIIPVVTGGDTTLMNHQQLSAYADALASDPVRRVRELVGACRKLGERRDDLRRVIKHGNAGNLWGQNMTVPELQLLRDCDTRWSSTYQMIGRAITLYPAIKMFLNSEDHRDLSHLQLTPMQLKVLVDLHQILEVPHAAQEVLSTSCTPTLSMALPSYELLITAWRSTERKMPEMSHFINAGIQRLEKYIRLARKTRIYALAMIINPTMKLEWMAQHWAEDDAKKASDWMTELMAQYAQHIRLTTMCRAPPSRVGVQNAAAAAAAAQKKGRSLLKSLSNAPRRSSSASNIPNNPSTSSIAASIPRSASTSSIPSASGPSSAPGPSSATPSMLSRLASPSESTLDNSAASSASSASSSATQDSSSPSPLPIDVSAASLELNKYTLEGLYELEIDKEGNEIEVDLLEYWEDRQYQFPLLFRVVLDVLPAQALCNY